MSLYSLTRRQTLRMMSASAGALLAPAGFAAPDLVTGAPRSSAFTGLQKSIQGRVLVRTTADFNAIRPTMVWNQRVAGLRSPEAIVQVTSAKDVVAAVRFARANGLKIAVRSGGHNYHGAVLRDGGLLLDLSRLRAISIDAPRRRASVQPAVKGGEFAAALVPHGLAFPVGHCSDVGLGGYLLNGGFGWNFGEWGPACMSVNGIEMVTANGELLYADEHNNADLYWAARGAGPGFFAVVTRFDVTLYPQPAGIHIYVAAFDLAAAPVIGLWLDQAVKSLHPTVEMTCTLGLAEPPGKPTISVVGMVCAASQAEAAARLAPLRSLPAGTMPSGPVLDQPTTFKELLQQVDGAFPNQTRMAGDQWWSEAKPSELISAVQSLAVDMPPAPTEITIVSLGGGVHAPRMPTPEQGSLSRGGGTFIGAYAFWDRPAQDAKSRAWVRSVLGAANHLGAGSYVGEADFATNPERVRSCFSPAAWDRLVALRKKFDPEDLFFSYLTT